MDEEEYLKKYKECHSLIGDYMFLLENSYETKLVFSVLMGSIFTMASMKKIKKQDLVRFLQEFIEQYEIY